ncbi:hypothetical protein SLS57_000620 [Botryosphaeria dothidea]
MRQSSRAAAAALAAASSASAASLADLCTVSNIQSALPSNGTLLGINLLPSSVSASPVYNASTGGGMGLSTTSSSATYSYCNVTLTYERPGKTDVTAMYAFPAPSDFKNRFYLSGGGGYSLSSSTTGGLSYGAVSGATDAGYDAFSTSYDEVALYGNGSINWDATYMFAYQALGELTKVGKAITKNLYSTDKLYTYFEGCSDGGREAMSQVQRWGEEYDGVVAGAPAFRYGQQQVNHVFSAAVEHVQDYYPPPCELEKIVNLTIAACDPLDGRTDGVISRTDLCKLKFDLNSTIGESYYCAAETSSSLGFGFSGGARRKRQVTTGSSTSTTPAQNGTVSAEGVAVAQAIYDGLHTSDGSKRAYLSYQIGCEFDDASTTYDNTTSSWELSIPSTGGEFVTKFVQLVDVDNLSNLDNVTYDTLIDWMNTAMVRYMDSLQTTLPDLTPFESHGGKLLHYHGESDPSIPAGSSVHYFDSVRTTMYPNKDYNESVEALGDWYRFYLIPGAAHCGTNSLQPGPWPQSNMDTIIDWVENGVVPERLNTTVSSGSYSGETQLLCGWPKRPYWNAGNSSSFECVYDQESIDSWTYTFDAFKVPVY